MIFYKIVNSNFENNTYSSGKSTGSAVVRFFRSSIRFNFHRHLLICHVPSPKVTIGTAYVEKIALYKDKFTHTVSKI